MSAPFGNRSPDLPPPGPELSRGFSRSASRPDGQVFGGASTRWSYSRPGASRRQHWHGHGASDSCVCELPDIRLSTSRCECHGPDRSQRRSCFRATGVMCGNPSNRPANSAEKIAISGKSAFLNAAESRCSLGFVVTQRSSRFPARCPKKQRNNAVTCRRRTN
jgi:hypothetical protein